MWNFHPKNNIVEFNGMQQIVATWTFEKKGQLA
jgi:hypothetical protein